MILNLQLTHEIQNLDLKSLEELRLFIDTLLKKQKQPRKKSEKNAQKKTLLADMERIPIPVNNIIIDRSEFYENRFYRIGQLSYHCLLLVKTFLISTSPQHCKLMAFEIF